MSTLYKIKKDITIDELLSQTNLIEINADKDEIGSMFVSTPHLKGLGCWFYFCPDERIITGFERFGANYEASEIIQQIIQNTLGVEVLSEHDDGFDDEPAMSSFAEPNDEPKLITYCTHIPISGSLPVTVQAYSKKEALQKVIDSEYEVDNSMFSLQDCESNTDLLTEDDFDDFDVLEEEVNEVQ